MLYVPVLLAVDTDDYDEARTGVLDVLGQSVGGFTLVDPRPGEILGVAREAEAVQMVVTTPGFQP